MIKRLWNWLTGNEEVKPIKIDPTFINNMVKHRQPGSLFNKEAHDKKIASVANKVLPKKLKEESYKENNEGAAPKS